MQNFTVNQLKKMNKIKVLFLFQFAGLALFAQDSIQKEEIYRMVEKMPEFPGGKEEMHDLIEANIQYPVKEFREQISGTVFVEVVIDKEGKIRDARVIRGVENGHGLDAEAIRLTQTMPAWYPGRQNDKPVN